MKALTNLTQEKFEQILANAYIKGQENKKINAKELIEEIKKQVLLSK